MNDVRSVESMQEATAPQSPVAQADPPEKVSESGYMVLAQQMEAQANTVSSRPTGGWDVVGTNITARSAEHAVRIYAEKLSEERLAGSRKFVAVPVRSWKPVTVAAKVTTTLVIEEAS